jgi:hypothetical protein
MTEQLPQPSVPVTPVTDPPVSKSPVSVRPSLLKKLYNHNPFYALSAVLMLFSIRSMYGDLAIGEINCWIMMGVMGGYTLFLAVSGWLIIRFGKVWEDARSIIVILLFLFMAISVSADDLFARVGSAREGVYIILVGYLFSAVVSELFLYGTGIRLGVLYRIPYHLILAAFFIAPWFCSSQQNLWTSDQQKWNLFLFPFISALMFLTLYPAVRKGSEYIQKSGTPWNWPWFPWITFGVFAALISFRSYLLCMAFEPDGPVWKVHNSRVAINFDSIWGIYFLIPICFVFLFLILEYAYQTKSKKLANKTLYYTPLLFLMSFTPGFGEVSSRFYQSVVHEYASPVWVTTCAIILFCSWAWLRKVPKAGIGLVTSLLVLSVVSPETVNFKTFRQPEAWPLLIAGAVLLFQGLSAQSSSCCALASIILTGGIWFVIPNTVSVEYRILIISHLLLVSWGLAGLFIRDSFTRFLRGFTGILGTVLFSFAVLSSRVPEVSYALKIIYATVLVSGFLMITIIFKSKAFMGSFSAMIFVTGYASTVIGFRYLVGIFGMAAVSAFVWSVAALILGIVISSHKAVMLPKRFSKESASNGNPV